MSSDALDDAFPLDRPLAANGPLEDRYLAAVRGHKGPAASGEHAAWRETAPQQQRHATGIDHEPQLLVDQGPRSPTLVPG